ncbi:MAG: hypothetical protein WAS73_16545 [Defluviicoccus sp.]
MSPGLKAYYKFRSSSSPESFKFILDIINKKRLFCADWKKLNDPMEGIFTYARLSNSEDNNENLGTIAIEKSKIKICSLSKDLNNYLLWCHYASGFHGVAIKISLNPGHKNLKEVKYSPELCHTNFCSSLSQLPLSAEEILCSKLKVWEYEKEYRILNDNQYFDIEKNDGRIDEVIVGPRLRECEIKFNRLKSACNKYKIAISTVNIDNTGGITTVKL